MAENQAILSDEEADRELAEAEKAFAEESGNDSVDIAKPKKEETAKRYQDILIALGFVRYDNKEKGISCKLKAGPLQIGRTFTENYPIGNMWVQCLKDSEHGKKGEFLKGDECKKIPQVNLFYRIRNGELPIPEPTVTGNVVGKSEKAVQIQFNEFGQTETEWWGYKAVYSGAEGLKYIPASYSKETEKYHAKMQVPRDILLENYEAELKEAPAATTTGNGERREEVRDKTKEEVDKGTLAEKITAKEPAQLEEVVLIEKLIQKYLFILERTTEAVRKSEVVTGHEKGYGVKFIFYSVKGALENGKGGDHEEQA